MTTSAVIYHMYHIVGSVSAPAILNALVEALEWILRSRGVKYIIHYLDDFLLLGHPNSEECVVALSSTLSTCRELGVPLAAVEGPAPRMWDMSNCSNMAFAHD